VGVQKSITLIRAQNWRCGISVPLLEFARCMRFPNIDERLLVVVNCFIARPFIHLHPYAYPLGKLDTPHPPADRCRATIPERDQVVEPVTGWRAAR
jgi:hypothetical protein